LNPLHQRGRRCALPMSYIVFACGACSAGYPQNLMKIECARVAKPRFLTDYESVAFPLGYTPNALAEVAGFEPAWVCVWGLVGRARFKAKAIQFSKCARKLPLARGDNTARREFHIRSRDDEGPGTSRFTGPFGAIQVEWIYEGPVFLP
jgi:hypothetical protein